MEQLDRSLVGKIQIVDVGKLWEHIPIMGWMIVENKRCGELRIGKHEADQHWFNLLLKIFCYTVLTHKSINFSWKALENDINCFDITISLNGFSGDWESVQYIYYALLLHPYKFDASGKGVIICLYVDDMLIFGTDQDQVNKTKEFLSSNFDMKDLGEAEVILGIRIKRGNNDPTMRPDIAFAVGKLSRYTSNPSALHWQALGRVGTLATIKSLKKPCITGFMKPINSTPPPLHNHSLPPMSSSMIVTPSTPKPTTTKPLYHRMPPLL
ncbi:zinc finger, CCHC-type containing protein [Tanacetum coccineum]